MGNGSGSVAFQAAERLLGAMRQLWAAVERLWRFASELLNAFFPGRTKKRKLRPWMLVRRSKGKAAACELAPREEDVKRLIERMKQLDDTERLAERAVGFTGTGEDFFANPRDVEAIVTSLVSQNPPFLHIAREAPAEDEGSSTDRQTEYVLRESDVVAREPFLLFIPNTGIEHLENKRPPGYPIIRTAKTLSDLRAAPLLYQAMPDDYVVSRLVEGAIPILAYREERKYLLFRPEERIVERTEHRRTYVPIDIETGGDGHSGRLIYLLFDRSTSLVRNCKPRGINAVMEMAIAVAMVRSDMGRPHATYYFRSFAERLDPLAKDPPVAAVTVQQKDKLVGRLYKTNFSGEATNVVEALETAADDIEKIVESGELGAGIKPRIGLLTDGRATIYRSTGLRLKRLGIELDTILIGREAARNPELFRISSTVTMVDPELYRQEARYDKAVARTW